MNKLKNRIFGVLTALYLIFPMGLSLAAEDAAKSPYGIQVSNGKVNFLQDGKVAGSYDMKSPPQIKLHSNDKKELLVLFLQPDGQYKNITLGSQKQVNVDGPLDRLLLSKTLNKEIGVTLASTSNIQKLDIASQNSVAIGGKATSVTITGAAKVTVAASAKLATLNVSNREAAVTAASKTSVGKTYAVSGASVKGTGTVLPSSTLTNKSFTDSFIGAGSSGNSGGSSGSNSGSPNSGTGSGTTTPSTFIVGIYPSLAELRVELSSPVALTANAFRVVCPRGDDMTVLKATSGTGTETNRIYTLSTSYYKNNEYILYVKLPGGAEISKTFTTRFEAPVLTGGSAQRESTTEAKFSVVSEDLGTLYYLVIPETNQRAAIPTAAQVKSNGTRFGLSTGMNIITLSNLTAQTAYKVYCATEGPADNVPVLQPSVSVPATPEEIETGSITISSVKMLPDQKFEVTLSAATESPLTASNISVTCPSLGTLHYNVITTTDNQIYTVGMQDGYFLVGNNTLALTITFPDKSTSKYSFYADIGAPKITALEAERTGASSATITFQSNEKGNYYYGVIDNKNSPIAANEAYTNGTKTALNAGGNSLKIDNLPADKKGVYLVTEDAVGNRMGYAETVAIPDDVTQPTPDADFEIVSVTPTVSSTQTKLSVKFDKAIDLTHFNAAVFSGAIVRLDKVGGSEFWERPAIQYSSPTGDTVSFTFGNTITSGTYKLTCKPSTGDEATKEFVYSQPNNLSLEENTVPIQDILTVEDTSISQESTAPDQLETANSEPEPVQ